MQERWQLAYNQFSQVGDKLNFLSTSSNTLYQVDINKGIIAKSVPLAESIDDDSYSYQYASNGKRIAVLQIKKGLTFDAQLRIFDAFSLKELPSIPLSFDVRSKLTLGYNHTFVTHISLSPRYGES